MRRREYRMDHMTGAVDLAQRMLEVAVRRGRQRTRTVMKSAVADGRKVIPCEGVSPLAIATLADQIAIPGEPKQH